MSSQSMGHNSILVHPSLKSKTYFDMNSVEDAITQETGSSVQKHTQVLKAYHTCDMGMVGVGVGAKARRSAPHAHLRRPRYCQDEVPILMCVLH